MLPCTSCKREQLKWVGLYYYSSGYTVTFPLSCPTLELSEYRNSHIGILADWFSALTVCYGRCKTGNMEEKLS